MPRATIPYDKLREAVSRDYPWPAFKAVGIVNDHVYHTPKVVYHRKNGAYVPYGWKVCIAGFRFSGIDEDLQPQYDYFRYQIVIPRLPYRT